MRAHGMVASKSDPCLYTLQFTSGQYMAITIYVDDFISIDNNQGARESLVKEMETRFKLVDLGQASWILGTKLEISDSSINIHQEKYVNDILHKYGMEECKPVATPAVARASIQEENSKSYENHHEYMSLVGSLIYLSVVTRPDIAFAVSKVGQTMANPTNADWNAAQRIVKFI
jgi:hypothetical protein